MKWLSPAKINLFLRVLRRREDGYHDLASLFQAVNLFDTLEVTFSDQDQLHCQHPSIACDQTNLVFKALNLFRSKTGLKFSVAIDLEKNIPIEAGLGGGSGNAATMLFALNELHNFFVDEKDLQKWSGEIGSDVPFFFSQGCAYCTGRGEIVENIDVFTFDKTLWLVKPESGLSTPLIFKSLNLEYCSKLKPELLLEKFKNGNYLYINDLQKCAFSLLPCLEKLKNDLMQQGFDDVFLTGSGTGLICVGDHIPAVTFPTKCYPLSFLTRREHGWYF